MLNKLHLLICLFAAIVGAVFNLINDVPLESAVINLIAIIVLFYFLGLATKYYLSKNVFKEENKEETAELNASTAKEASETQTATATAETSEISGTTDVKDEQSEPAAEERRPRRPAPVGADE